MSFDSECIYIKCLHVDTITGGGVTTVVGTPTPPRTFSTVIGIQPTDTIANGMWKLDNKLAAILPAEPPDLSAITIALADPTYSAYRADASGVIVAGVQNNALGLPETQVTPEFGNATTGTLAALVKNTPAAPTQQGSVILTDADESGTYMALIVVSDTDYTVTPPGLYQALTAKIVTTVPLVASNTVGYSYQLTHTVSGDTNAIIFYQDNSVLPSITAASFTGITGAVTYISGVPTVAVGTSINVQFTVNNAIRKFYNSVWVASATSPELTSDTALPTGADRNEGSNPTFTLLPTAITGQYNEAISVTCAARSAASQTTTQIVATTARIDTVSPIETTVRVQSGSGTFPAGGYGGVYVSTDSLTTNEELQLINGLFRYPQAVDYTSNTPSGPDYTLVASVPPAAATARWVTVNLGSPTNVSNVIVTFGTAVNMPTVILPYQCYIKVQGSTGWLDLNAAYAGVGTPVADGTPNLVIYLSSGNVKYATFGPTTYTGTVYLRVGLPPGSAIQFGNISAQFIS